MRGLGSSPRIAHDIIPGEICMRKISKNTQENIIAIIVITATILGSAAAATILTGQSPAEVFSGLMWITGGWAAVILVGTAAAIIIYFLLQRRGNKSSVEGDVETVLSEIVERLKGEYKPLRIILFGSYAYGTPGEDSDIDLFILKNTRKRKVDRFVEVKRIIYDPNRKIPVSPLVYTPEELEERLRIGDDFIKEIIRKGIVLYERAGS